MNKCQAATRLMSLKRDRPLTLGERAALRLHLAMCSACRECDRQFELLHHVNRRFEPPTEDRMTDDAPRH
ncbi:zf-HC2 domain-containing protein [Halomonas sp. I1]|uniref:zf-HC2 domain-containing protein n=1 Tax=Halomonas sp. I1 TaxID=393536 RepID=UPI0028DE7273|nr:zf-HC2 domain-containing protein [Halomonas sp. I1]MDT8894538.1 zf-HC2 domain-containing protein [Halomonas sp. I1]